MTTSRLITFECFFFRKYIDKIHVSLKSPTNGHFTQRHTHTYDSNSLDPFLELEMFQTKVVEKIKTFSLCSIA